jgi:hypothetical protein
LEILPECIFCGILSVEVELIDFEEWYGHKPPEGQALFGSAFRREQLSPVRPI